MLREGCCGGFRSKFSSPSSQRIQDGRDWHRAPRPWVATAPCPRVPPGQALNNLPRYWRPAGCPPSLMRHHAPKPWGRGRGMPRLGMAQLPSLPSVQSTQQGAELQATRCSDVGGGGHTPSCRPSYNSNVAAASANAFASHEAFAYWDSPRSCIQTSESQISPSFLTPVVSPLEQNNTDKEGWRNTLSTRPSAK